MTMCYLCDLCQHCEYIASNTRIKCYGESGAILDIKTIDYDKNNPLETCWCFKPKKQWGRMKLVDDNHKITIKDLVQLESLVRDMWVCLEIYTYLSTQIKTAIEDTDYIKEEI